MLPGETVGSGAPNVCPDCGKELKLAVLQSAAGYYLGTWCNCGPYSRESEYYPSRAEAEAALRRAQEFELHPDDTRTNRFVEELARKLTDDPDILDETKIADRIPLANAQTTANDLLAQLTPYLEKAEIAGSIRRKSADIGDIDIVAITTDFGGLMAKLKEIDPSARGGKIKQFFGYQGRPVNLFLTTGDSWGATLLEATGSDKYVIGLRMKAKKKGWKLSYEGLFDEMGQKIAGETEEGVYEALWAPDPDCPTCKGQGGGWLADLKCPTCKGKPEGKRYKKPENRI